MKDEVRQYSQEDVDNARRRGEEKLGNLTSDQIKALRVKAKKDLFFLCYGVLGYDKLSRNLHLDFTRWIGRTNISHQFRLGLLPRSHFKSTIFTIGDSLQIALPDDLRDSPYPRNLGTEVRVLLSHETDSSAQRFLSSIRDHLFRGEVLLALFPELIPQKGRTDNKGELELNREKIWSEPTFSTMGVGGKKQGAHFDFIKADDLQGESATASKTEKATLVQWVDNLQSYLVTPATDHIDFVGTRWAFDDVWKHISDMYGKKLAIYHRPVVERDEEGNLVPIFPEQFSLESLEILKKNKKVWNAQYMNNPAAGAAAFSPEWKKFYNWRGRNVQVFDGENSLEYSVSELDKVIFVDPAVTGNFGYAVTGMNHKGDIFILESHKREWNQPDFCNFLFSQVLKWNPRVVVIEDQLFMMLYQHWLGQEMRSRRIQFKIEAGKTRNKKKEDRIYRLSPYFEAGQIFFNIEQHAINEEYDEFGASDNIHILDALAYGPEFWRKPPRGNVIEANREAERSVLRSRDASTGYSNIYEG